MKKSHSNCHAELTHWSHWPHEASATLAGFFYLYPTLHKCPSSVVTHTCRLSVPEEWDRVISSGQLGPHFPTLSLSHKQTNKRQINKISWSTNCMHTHICIAQAQTHMYVCARVHILCACVCTCMHTQVCMCRHTNTYTHTHTNTPLLMCKPN